MPDPVDDRVDSRRDPDTFFGERFASRQMTGDRSDRGCQPRTPDQHDPDEARQEQNTNGRGERSADEEKPPAGVTGARLGA